MEPGVAGGVEGRTPPPALPVKQHRSRYSCSSVDLDSDSGVFSPLALQHQKFTYSDVFSEPTDCNATQCPIHQRYNPSQRHQERFFSDGTPPLVPKKLARTLSLPGVHVSPSSPLFTPMSPMSPKQRHSYPHNFDNPVYMLAPIADTHDEEDVTPLSRSPVPSLPLSQLSFDTPDEQLPYLFSSLNDQGLVSQGIQHRHLLFLRSMAQGVEARILLQEEASISSYQPQDFLLCEAYTPRRIGDALYYSLHSPRFPTRVLGARIHMWANSASSAHASPQPSHVNIQEVIVHFPIDNTLKNESTMLKSQDSTVVSAPSQPDGAPPKPPQEGSIELDKSQADPRNVTAVSSLLHKGYSVSIERDLPHATLEDFIQDSRLLQRSDPSLYERQLCVLLLQLAMGFQHLCNNTATCIELMPRCVFLVWPRKRGEHTKGEVIEEKENNAAEKGEAERGIDGGQPEKRSRVKEETEWEERRNGLQVLWRKWGSPRVVLAPQPPHLSPSNPTSSINTQLGALLLYCLQPRGSLTSHSQGSAATLSDSPYTMGLLHLASLLQDENSRLQIADTVAILQALLWGPQAQLFKFNRPGTATATTVHNWLIIKRALLVMKLAERGLVKDQSVLDWEECLCLQYLSVSDSETVTRAAERLGLILL